MNKTPFKMKNPLKQVSKAKAKKILKHGSVYGHNLTDKQKNYFGFIAGGGEPKE